MGNFLLIIVILFLTGCGYSNIRFVEGTSVCYADDELMKPEWCANEFREIQEREQRLERERQIQAYKIKKQQEEDDKIPIYKMCMMWDGAYNGSDLAIKIREKIAQSLERRGQDPLYCRNTSNSNDAARRAEDAAKAAERRARAAEDAAYAAQQEAYENRRRQDDYEYNQQNQQYDPPDFTPGTWD